MDRIDIGLCVSRKGYSRFDLEHLASGIRNHNVDPVTAPKQLVQDGSRVRRAACAGDADDECSHRYDSCPPLLGPPRLAFSNARSGVCIFGDAADLQLSFIKSTHQGRRIRRIRRR